MSDDTVRSIGKLASETAVAVAWAQWSALTPLAAPVGDASARSIIDPEALVLLSLAVRDRERRLDDLLAGWARAASSLLSIQRLRTIAKAFPSFVSEQVPDFARYAADAGDRRWRAHAADADGAHRSGLRSKDLGPLRLRAGPALMLRLRSGIGVGAKADLLAVLLGLGGDEADLKELSLATGYSDRALRTATEEMALAGFIHDVEGPPSAYRADPGAWGQLLGGDHPGRGALPPWRYWWVAFSFLAAVIAWEREASREGWSSYVVSSRARDLVETHGRRLRHTDVRVNRTSEARGEAYLDVIRDVTERVASWTME